MSAKRMYGMHLHGIYARSAPVNNTLAGGKLRGIILEEDYNMTSREFARYNPKTTIEHPEDDMPDAMPLKNKPALEKAEGWKKTKLEKASVKGDWLTLKDDIGLLQMNWKSLKPGSDTYRNLVRLLKGDDRAWRLKWRSDSNGVRYVTEILDDEQYKRYQKTSWQNKRLYKEGFATANPFTT